MRKLFGVAFGLLLCGCATHDTNEPSATRLRFTPGAEPHTAMESMNSAAWSPLKPDPSSPNRKLSLKARAGIGHKFPVHEEGGPTLFEVSLIQGNDDSLVVEVRSNEGTQTLELERNAYVPVKVAGITYRLCYSAVNVSSTAGFSTTNKAAFIVTAPRR